MTVTSYSGLAFWRAAVSGPVNASLQPITPTPSSTVRGIERQVRIRKQRGDMGQTLPEVPRVEYALVASNIAA